MHKRGSHWRGRVRVCASTVVLYAPASQFGPCLVHARVPPPPVSLSSTLTTFFFPHVSQGVTGEPQLPQSVLYSTDAAAYAIKSRLQGSVMWAREKPQPNMRTAAVHVSPGSVLEFHV